MKKYPIKLQKKDFKFINTNQTAKGTRTKRFIIDSHGKRAFFKYEVKDRNLSEACSEKMAYEIAKILNIPCAKIELARDSNGELGVLNYFFVDNKNTEHVDAIAYINNENTSRPSFYTISNIKYILDSIDHSLFKSFIRMQIFDALIGEQDRHEENWGILYTGKSYIFSPLYDNGDSLLNFFKDDTIADNYYNGIKSFDSYINNSKTFIYKEGTQKRYKHFELIKELNNKYHDIVQNELRMLENLTDKKIEIVVNQIPDALLTKKHKTYIIEYLKRRRDILKKIN